MSPIECYIDKVILAFINSQVVKNYEIRSLSIKAREGYIRIKAELTNGDTLEAFEFVTLDNDEIKLQTYRFHWQDKNGRLIKRWDNAPHHPELENFPHHYHIPDEPAKPFRLINVKEILKEIEEKL